VEIPQGSHTVIMTFSSAAFRNGAVLTLLTMLASIMALLYFLRTERKSITT
jgi:uncharacterized membrane protein YfhO